jgi:predicted TIM-barrel fold metal-dependent hydrolase
VLIQHAGNYHNQYIIECVKRFPDRFGAVVWVDVEKPDAPDTLERLSKEEGVVGVRLHPTERSPGSDPLAIWRKAAAPSMWQTRSFSRSLRSYPI